MPDQDLFLERALLAEALVQPEQIREARKHATSQGVDFVDALIATGALSSRDLAVIRADLCEVPFVNLADYEPCFGNAAIIPRNVAERFQVFPLFRTDDVLTLAMHDPLDLDAADHVRQVVRCEVDPVLVEREQLLACIGRVYSLSQSQSDESGDDVEGADTGLGDVVHPIAAAVNQILADAADQQASDVHLNPDEHELHVRYRIDGVLRERQGPSLSMHGALVQRLKVMAHLDLTQTRRPQDGKFRFRHGNTDIDVRMSTMPTVSGENVVLRLLSNNQAIQDFSELGMPAPMAIEMDELLKQPYGILLVTGPTGSGKSTSLYTSIQRINDPARNIMTIEDPVEIRLPYVRQIQVNPEIGLTFANALRSILRQDPDVVLVGEIRDNETATIALQAALTGHLVLATLHTNDAVGAIARLRDYGLPPFVINSAVLGVMAQRLVRRVCSHCVTTDAADELTLRRFSISDSCDGFVRGRGCNRCGQTGFRGRVGIYELLTFTPRINDLIENGASVETIRRAAVDAGMRLMWEDGLDKARLGITTLHEVAKVVALLDVESSGQGAARECDASLDEATRRTA